MRKSESKKPVELRPDGWTRFKAAVNAAIKSGPKHRSAKKASQKYSTR